MVSWAYKSCCPLTVNSKERVQSARTGKIQTPEAHQLLMWTKWLICIYLFIVFWKNKYTPLKCLIFSKGQYGNEPKHSSKSTRKWNGGFWNSQVKPRSRFTKMLWDDLKQALHARNPSNIAQLKKNLHGVGENSSWLVSDICRQLLETLTEFVVVLEPRVHLLFPQRIWHLC